MYKIALRVKFLGSITGFCWPWLGSLLMAQGPLDGYLKGKGVLDLAPSFSVMSARQLDGASGQTYNLPYRGNMLSLFAEYGLTARLDVVATGAYVFTTARSGLQDGGVFVKYSPWQWGPAGKGTLRLLVGTGAAFPLANYEPGVTGALGQKAVLLPLRLIAQYESPWGPFVNLSGGYNRRLDRPSAGDIARIRQQRPDYEATRPPSSTTALLKIGLPAKHYYMDAWIERQQAFGGVDYVPDLPDLPQVYGVSYTQTGGTLFYSEHGGSGFFLSGAYIFQGRNVSRILRVTGGVVIRIE